jgi:hypothetical protein
VSIRTDPRAAASKRPVPEGRDARSLDHDSREWVRPFAQAAQRETRRLRGAPTVDPRPGPTNLLYAKRP